ncbi:MAG: helix-turn-helix transcriptional regulator [Gloeobacteraceae cyanobacterium ES-bin-144]|nr:helix-turn-helix transcriptional regulator [Verrucomicrobiales bacterium]
MSNTLPNFISPSVLRGRYVFLDLDPSAAEHPSVACAGWEECAPDYIIRRQGFRFPAIEYIASGEWELITAKGKWTLGAGSVFTYGPETAYSLKAVSKTGLSKYFLDFSDAQAVAHLQKAGLTDGLPSSLMQRRWLHDLLDQLIDTAQMRVSTRRKVAGMIAALLLERIREDLQAVQPVNQAQLTYERCRDYLAAHYLDVSNLSDAARICGVSLVHLCRLFQRYATETPNSFVTRLKINHAAERIARGNLPVKAAAAEVGFDDPYHFSRVFKKVYGIPPSRFGRA